MQGNENKNSGINNENFLKRKVCELRGRALYCNMILLLLFRIFAAIYEWRFQMWDKSKDIPWFWLLCLRWWIMNKNNRLWWGNATYDHKHIKFESNYKEKFCGGNEVDIFIVLNLDLWIMRALDAVSFILLKNFEINKFIS